MENLISIGWDVGGWTTNNNAIVAIRFENEKPILFTKIVINKKELENFVRKKFAEILTELCNYSNLNCKNVPIIFAIDAPLGFPSSFIKMINGEIKEIKNKEYAKELCWRITDLYIANKFKYYPLSPTFSYLTSSAAVAQTFLKNWDYKSDGFVCIPFDALNKSNRIIMEVYPAILDKDKIQFPQECKTQHEKDAYLCALIGAKVFKDKSYDLDPSLNMDIIKHEGWIYYP